MSLDDHNQVSKAFSVAQLAEHHHEQFVPTCEMLHISIATILLYDAVELAAIQKIHKWRENEFGIVYVPFLYKTAKIQNQIRSLLKTLQRTKYQLFQRTLSVFNGTVISHYINNPNVSV